MSLVTYWFISIGFPCRSKQWMQTKYKLRMRFVIKVWTLLTIIVNFLSSIHWLAAALLYMSDGTTILMRLHMLMKCFLCVIAYLIFSITSRSTTHLTLHLLPVQNEKWSTLLLVLCSKVESIRTKPKS